MIVKSLVGSPISECVWISPCTMGLQGHGWRKTASNLQETKTWIVDPRGARRGDRDREPTVSELQSCYLEMEMLILIWELFCTTQRKKQVSGRYNPYCRCHPGSLQAIGGGWHVMTLLPGSNTLTLGSQDKLLESEYVLLYFFKVTAMYL